MPDAPAPKRTRRAPQRRSIEDRLAEVLSAPTEGAIQPASQSAPQPASVPALAPAAAPAPTPTRAAPTTARTAPTLPFATGLLATGRRGAHHLGGGALIETGATFTATRPHATLHAAQRDLTGGRTLLRARPDGTLVCYQLWLRDFAGIDAPGEYPCAVAYRADGKLRIGRYAQTVAEATAEACRMQLAWEAKRDEHARAGKPWRAVGFAAYVQRGGLWTLAPWN